MDIKQSDYLNGDPDLVKAIELVEEQIAAGQPLEENLESLKRHLTVDVGLRTRIKANYDAATDLNHLLKVQGVVVEVTDRDDNTKVRNVELDAGLLRAPISVIDDVNKSIIDLIAEVAPTVNGLPEKIIELLAPLHHRTLVADSTLLELRKFFHLNMNYMHPRAASHLSEVVAKAEISTNGTYLHSLALNAGYDPEKWNFNLIAKQPDVDGKLVSRKIRMYADGREEFALVFNNVNIEQAPHGDQMQVVCFIDHELVNIITVGQNVVPAYSVSCWRDVTEEEAALDVWKEVDGYFTNLSKQVEFIMAAQLKAIDEAAKPKGPKLILPDHLQGGKEAPSLVLPN